jgi:hypothetical protein
VPCSIGVLLRTVLWHIVGSGILNFLVNSGAECLVSPRLMIRTGPWKSVILCLLAGWLPGVRAQIQTGPTVQIFTSTTPGGGVRLQPLEHLPLDIQFSVIAGYDTNVDTTSDGQGSAFTTATVNLNYSFGTERTRANLSTNANFSYYDEPARSGFDYTIPFLSLNLGVSHGVSERMSLNGTISAHYGNEPDFSKVEGQNRRVGNYFTMSDSISMSYAMLERVSTVTSYSFAMTQYGKDEMASLAQDTLSLLENHVEHTVSQTVQFAFLPFTSLTANYSLQLVNYEVPRRDSTTHSVLLGISQTFGPHLSGVLHAGPEFRHSEQTQSDSINPRVDGALNYVVSEKTSLNWTIQYSTEEPEVIGSASQTSFRTGLGATHALTPRITSSLSVNYVRDENNATDLAVLLGASSFPEDSVDFGLSLQYAVTDRLSITAGLHYTQVLSDVSQRSYSRSSYNAGLSYSF